MEAENDELDWEIVLWFLLANNLDITNAHEKRMKELKSTIETMDAELAAVTESFIRLTHQKRAFREMFRREGREDYAKDPKWISLSKELDRAIEHFKQRVNAMG